MLTEKELKKMALNPRNTYYLQNSIHWEFDSMYFTVQVCNKNKKCLFTFEIKTEDVYNPNGAIIFIKYRGCTQKIQGDDFCYGDFLAGNKNFVEFREKAFGRVKGLIDDDWFPSYMVMRRYSDDDKQNKIWFNDKGCIYGFEW